MQKKIPCDVLTDLICFIVFSGVVLGVTGETNNSVSERVCICLEN